MLDCDLMLPNASRPTEDRRAERPCASWRAGLMQCSLETGVKGPGESLLGHPSHPQKKKKGAQQRMFLRDLFSPTVKANCFHEKVLNEISRFISAKFYMFGTLKFGKNRGRKWSGFIPPFPFCCRTVTKCAREEGLALCPTGGRCHQEWVRQGEKVPPIPLPQEMPMTSHARSPARASPSLALRGDPQARPRRAAHIDQ